MSVVRFVILLTSFYLFLGCENKSRKEVRSSLASNDLVDLNKRKIEGNDREFSRGGSGIYFHSEPSLSHNVSPSWSTEEVTVQIESLFNRMFLSGDDAEKMISNDFRGMELVPSSVEKILLKSDEISLWEGAEEERRVGKTKFIQSLLESVSYTHLTLPTIYSV